MRGLEPDRIVRVSSIGPVTPVTEAEIRGLVHEVVLPTLDAGSGRAIDEFVLSDLGRIDLAFITDELFGYEFKSDLDTLSRLPRQMDAYGQIFTYCTLVITERHISKARDVLLPGWGLGLVRRTSHGDLTYRQVRGAKPLRRVQKLSLAQLLWRDETLRALEILGQADGYRSQPRDVLWRHLANVCELPRLQDIVTTTLTERRGWRDVQEPHDSAARRLPAGGSSRFLARRRR